MIAIGVFIRDRDMGSVVADMKTRVAKLGKLPQGYYMSWSGEFENQERAMARLSVVVPLSVLLIFILLFDAFQSFKSALLIILNIPFAMIGGIFALLITGIPLSVSAAIGFIALFGQAVLNGVVMVTYFNQLKRAGATPVEAVIKGSLVRLRTVLMTAMLAMFGLLPMALSHEIGSETQKPLAVVVIGGLITATLLTLIVLPTLFTCCSSAVTTTSMAPRTPSKTTKVNPQKSSMIAARSICVIASLCEVPFCFRLSRTLRQRLRNTAARRSVKFRVSLR